ncbi:FecR domain-containing protein [Roseibium sp. SCPC15]|uniref:FecR domain-containing protein n=1 Tax=Roseibium sp. SCP15 TaxID=3141376 RepID=UPI00333B62DC
MQKTTHFAAFNLPLASVLMTSVAIGLLPLGNLDAQASTTVGSAAAVNTEAFGASPGTVRKAKLIGDNVFYDERIETSGTGLVQILLNDGSSFTVGPNSDLVIDEFVYDPDGGSGKLVASFSKGVARFVGGKLSKKKGGVTVKTPVGTIGIRGAITNINLAAPKPVISLVFGDELTFTGNDGTSKRVYQAGYSLEVGGGGTGVRRTTSGDLTTVQGAISSKPGQTGGSSSPPTNQRVAGSGFSRINSDLGQIITAPPPKPQAVQSTPLIETEDTLVQVQKVTEEQTVTIIEDEITDDGGSDDVEQTVDVRVLIAGSTFAPVWDSSRVVTAPGAQGLLGGSTGLNTTVAFSFLNVTSGSATSLVQATIEGNKVAQFVFEGDGTYYYSQAYTDAGNVVQEGNSSIVPVVPSVDPAKDGNVTSYAWGAQQYNENFVAFAHLPNVTPGGAPSFDIEDLIVGFYGVGTDFDNFGNASDPTEVRRYTLSTDPTTMFQLGTEGNDGSFTPFTTQALFLNPLVAQELGTGFLSNVGSTDLLLIENAPDTLDQAHFLAASFYIDGTGSSQKSFISLAVGDVYLDDSNQYGAMGTGRRGSHRMAASQTAALYGGGIDTFTGPTGGDFFGSNAQSFVFGADFSGPEGDSPYGDSYIDRPSGVDRPDTLSGTIHVGSLDESVSTTVSSLSRTDRTLTGYAAGVLESTVNYYDYGVGPVGYSSTGPSDFSVTFDSSEHSLGGSLTVRDTNGQDADVDSITVRFGYDQDGSGTWRAAFIDDDTYAARNSRDRSATYLITDDGEKVEHDPDNNPNTYFVPHTLVKSADGNTSADNAILGGTTACTCAFLEWGYWGTSLDYDDKDGNLTSSEQRRDQFHLGTWVAGDVTNSVNLPNSGSASYAGHAVGNVINNGAQYLAAGDFNMSVNFADRAGTATISNFDGRTMSGVVNEQTIANGNLFSGTLSGTGSLTGDLNTSFVGGPGGNHDGVIGNFNASDGSWSANGIVAGEKQ